MYIHVGVNFLERASTFSRKGAYEESIWMMSHLNIAVHIFFNCTFVSYFLTETIGTALFVCLFHRESLINVIWIVFRARAWCFLGFGILGRNSEGFMRGGLCTYTFSLLDLMCLFVLIIIVINVPVRKF